MRASEVPVGPLAVLLGMLVGDRDADAIRLRGWLVERDRVRGVVVAIGPWSRWPRVEIEWDTLLRARARGDGHDVWAVAEAALGAVVGMSPTVDLWQGIIVYASPAFAAWLRGRCAAAARSPDADPYEPTPRMV